MFKKRRRLIQDTQRILFEDAAASPIVHPSMTNAYREDRLSGLVPQLGEGIGSLWTDLNVSVNSGDGYVRTGQTFPRQKPEPRRCP